MKILFDRAKWSIDMDGAWLMIKVDSKEAAQFCEEMKQGKKYVAELKQHRNKRSLDANNLAWKLLGELSAVLRIPDVELYREYVKDAGGNYTIVPIREDLLEEWDHLWCEGHYGRLTIDIGECRNTPGYHNVKTYKGSSDYDTAQMSRLLDLIIEDCKQNGIDVMSERERSLLLEEWGKKDER